MKRKPVEPPSAPEPAGYVRVLPGRLLLAKDGTVRGYGGQVIPADDPAVVAHPHPGLDFVRCEPPEETGSVAGSEDGATHGVAGAGEAGGPSSVSARRSPDEGEHFAE